jgi:transposase
MARPVGFTQDDVSRAIDLRDMSDNPKEKRAGIIFLLIAVQGLSREQVADSFGIDVKTVFNDMKLVRNPDKSQGSENWGGRRHFLMTEDEEKHFLSEFENEGKTGLIITMPELHAKYNSRVGKNTSKSTFYKMLKRHKWKKNLPDTKYLNNNPEIQEEFKKKLSKWRWIRHS